MPTLIVLIGPTGVGKTELSLRLAENFQTHIVSADSRQLYAELKIGTATPTPEQLERVPHHLVGTLHLTDYYSAAQYETEAMEELLQTAGYDIVPFTEQADVYVVNTCTVTNTAASKSRQKIHYAKRMNPNALCVVVGCFVQCASEEERKALDADLIVGAKQKNELVNLIQQALKDHEKIDVVHEVTQFKDFEAMPVHCFESMHRAFLKVQDGCNQFCSYCAIPFARGRERSLNHEQVIQIAKDLCDKGHTEIVLTGIHTGRYFDGEYDLAKLMKALLENTPESVYYRISSIEITEVSDELIALMQENPRMCHHLHIPVQSACNETLKRMNRPYTIEEFKEKIAYIRSCIPDISISTDVIAGFVQESDEEFETTYNNLAELELSFFHVFPYSKRNGTKASTLKGEINGKIAKARVARLLELSNECRKRDMQRFNPVQVLIERQQDGYYTGYTNQYHPCKILSDIPLSGRITIEWQRIEDGTYYGKKD